MHFGRKGKSREKDAQNGQLWHLGKSFRSIHRAAAAADDDDAADDDEKGDHQGDILNTISVQKCRKNNKKKTFEKTERGRMMIMVMGRRHRRTLSPEIFSWKNSENTIWGLNVLNLVLILVATRRRRTSTWSKRNYFQRRFEPPFFFAVVFRMLISDRICLGQRRYPTIRIWTGAFCHWMLHLFQRLLSHCLIAWHYYLNSRLNKNSSFQNTRCRRCLLPFYNCIIYRL